jgi:hypothetical protein
VKDLSGNIPMNYFARTGCGFLATVLFLRWVCLRSPHAFGMYFEYLSECVNVHASLAVPKLNIISVSH